MATDIRFLLLETSIAGESSVNNTKVYVLNENDGDLGIRLLGYVDGSGNARRLLVKDNDGKLNDLYLTDVDHAGTTCARLIHAGDPDNYIQMETDKQLIHVGGVDMVEYVEGATDYVDNKVLNWHGDNVSAGFGNTAASPDSEIQSDGTNLLINSLGNDTDTIIKGDTENVVYVNAGTDRLGIKVAAPKEDIDINGYAIGVHTVTTSDDTDTDIATVSLAEGDTVSIEVDIVGEQASNNNHATYKLAGLFYRGLAGNVTQVGSTQNVYTIESDSNWNASLVADTSNQTIDVRVQAVASPDVSVTWKAVVKYYKL